MQDNPAPEHPRLKRWRLSEGLTLEEVSGLTGVSMAMLSRAERGLRNLSPRAKVRIARRLAVPLHLLFDPEDPEPLAAEVAS